MMAYFIVKHDGARVGFVDASDHGAELIGWFHRNAGGQSMSYYMEHGGYSVEEVEALDCRDVSSFIEAIAARLREARNVG